MNKGYITSIISIMLVCVFIFAACNPTSNIILDGSSEVTNSSEPTNTSSNNTTSNNNTSITTNTSRPSSSSNPTSSSKPTTSTTPPTIKPGVVKSDPNPNHTAPKPGDVYETDDYIYTYEWRLYELDSVYDPTENYYTEGGWNVRAKENKADYEGIYEAIYGKPVISMYQTFVTFDKLEIAPEIPKHITNMVNTYAETSLKVAPTLPNGVNNIFGAFRSTNITSSPVIPSSVTDMTYAFENCKKLTTAPIIPSSVTYLSYTFMNCESLTGTITINYTPSGPTSVVQYGQTFSGTVKPIVLTGTTPVNVLQKLALTAKAGNVTVQ